MFFAFAFIAEYAELSRAALDANGKRGAPPEGLQFVVDVRDSRPRSGHPIGTDGVAGGGAAVVDTEGTTPAASGDAAAAEWLRLALVADAEVYAEAEASVVGAAPARAEVRREGLEIHGGIDLVRVIRTANIDAGTGRGVRRELVVEDSAR